MMKALSICSLLLAAIFVPVAVLAFDPPSKENVELSEVSIVAYWQKLKEWNSLQLQAVINDLAGLYTDIDDNWQYLLEQFNVSYGIWWETRNMVSNFTTLIQQLLAKHGSAKRGGTSIDFFGEAFIEIQDLQAALGIHPERSYYPSFTSLENRDLIKLVSATDSKMAERLSRIKENLAHKIKEFENFRNLVWLFRMIERLEFNVKRHISQREVSVDYDIEASGLYDAFQAWKNGDLRGELEALKKAWSYFQSAPGEIFEKTREDMDEKIRYLEGKIASLPQTPPAPPSVPPKDGAKPPRVPTGDGRGANVPTSHDGRALMSDNFWMRVLQRLVERFMSRISAPTQPAPQSTPAPTAPIIPPTTQTRTRPVLLPVE